MGAPKGNQYAIGNNGGRPPIYEKPEDLQKACDDYFAYIIKEKEPATVTGLSLFLGFCHRSSLDDYENQKEFSYIIKKARSRVENSYEKKLNSGQPTGAIFALKNMGWKDKTEIDGNTKISLEIVRKNASASSK